MSWSEITSVVSLIAALVAVYGVVFNYGKLNVKVEILWDIFKEDARQNLKRKGNMVAQSPLRLTNQGLALIPTELKSEIKNLFSYSYNGNSRPKTEDIVKRLGGVSRLRLVAEKADISLNEFIVVIETYIHMEV